MRMNFLVAGLAAMGVAACATAQADSAEISERAAEKLAEFEATGEVVNCINTARIRSIDPLDDRHFLIRVGGGKYYLNKPSRKCSGASRGSNRLQYKTSIGQLCRNQIIDVVDNTSGFSTGSCGLGSFEELEKVPTE